MLAIAGYMPDLVACADCAAYESDVMYFLPDSGILRCKDCFAGYGRAVHRAAARRVDRDAAYRVLGF